MTVFALVPLVAGLAVAVAAASWARRPVASGAGFAAGRLVGRTATGGDPSGVRAGGGGVRSVAAPRWFVILLQALDVPGEAATAWSGVQVAVAGVGLWCLWSAPGATVALAAVAVAGHQGAHLVRRRWRSGAGPPDDELLAVLPALEASLRSGASLLQALERVVRGSGAAGTSAAVGAGRLPIAGAVVEDLRVLARAMTGGQRRQDALDGWAEARAGTGVVLVVDALSVAGATGASQAGALAAVAETLRDRQARSREVRALAAQARASAVVLVLLPAVFAVVVAALDPRIAHFLLATAPGWLCLVGGLVLDLAGAWWMAVLIRGVR